MATIVGIGALMLDRVPKDSRYLVDIVFPVLLLTEPNRDEKADIIAGELGQLQQVASAVVAEVRSDETTISVTTFSAPSNALLRQIDDICSSPATRWKYLWGDVWTCTVNGKP